MFVVRHPRLNTLLAYTATMTPPDPHNWNGPRDGVWWRWVRRLSDASEFTLPNACAAIRSLGMTPDQLDIIRVGDSMLEGFPE